MATANRRRLLVADGDAALLTSVVGFMSARGYLVDHAASALEAANVLKSQPIDVLVADLALAGSDGMALLATARRSAPSTRSIVIGRDLSGVDHEAATRLGAVRVLAKPLSLLDLGEAVDVAADCEDGFHGWLHRLSLLDVLQMFHLSRASVTLRLRGAIEGTMVLIAGELIHAESGDASGSAAVVRLLSARRGIIESGPVTSRVATISSPFEHVILDSLRLADERRGRPSIGPLKRISSPNLTTWRPLPMTAAAPGARDAHLPSGVQGAEPRSGSGSSERLHTLVRQALATYAPGAFAWLCDVGTRSIERVDEWESPADLAGAIRSFGVALALAERSDPRWTRIEVMHGDLAIALLRSGATILAVARVAGGDEVVRRFRFEITQLARWWQSEALDVE